MKREQLNAYFYQQAVRFADNFADPEREEFLSETADRQAFEQELLAKHHVQNVSLKRPLVAGSLLLAAVLAAGSAFYWQTGRYQQVQQGEQALQSFLEQKAEESSEQRNDRYIINLQNQLRQNANNGDLWFELGQAYSLNNDFDAAMICYNNALRVLGRKAAVIGAMATAEYYRNKQMLSPQAKAWIDEALQLDPKESSSLLLLASDAFLNNNPQQAREYWLQVLDGENQAIDRREIIQSIKMAEQMSRALDK
ncbi:TPR domain-containing protein [Frederiksenia canicola]|uniref:Cytochrome C biogenesis protein n=1 Tax=Frederiksenia canicola TaxID=123824 RepID=A0AAE6X3B6_9PAST|nr:cytochrome C biogenesis protein [Frederiksenia canicola]QIM64030.1 cytochrome C biogenesis protein [Frederiksenia canicola]RPE95645.1 formate-dependent nitrite reductase complex subunit NrfG [Frederiksenia canicola]